MENMENHEIGNGWLKTVEYHPVIGSTNDRAKEILKNDAIIALPGLIYAETQTAGRGRGANHWWGEPGAIAMTLILDAGTHHLDHATAPHLSLGIGLAVLNVLRTVIPDQQINIHWPNDVYVAGRKISGILIESPTPRAFVIGIGLNTNNSAKNAPEELRPRIVTLRDILEKQIDNQWFINSLLHEIVRILEFFPHRLEPLINKVQSHLFQFHQPVTLICGESMIRGTCLGIASDASLRLLTEQGEKHFFSGILEDSLE